MSELTNLKKLLYKTIENNLHVNKETTMVKLFDYYTTPIEISVNVIIKNITITDSNYDEDDIAAINKTNFVFRYTDFDGSNIVCDLTERINSSFTNDIKYIIKKDTTDNKKSFFICLTENNGGIKRLEAEYDLTTHIEIKYGNINSADLEKSTSDFVADDLTSFDRNINYIKVTNMQVDNIAVNSKSAVEFGNDIIAHHTVDIKGTISSGDGICKLNSDPQDIGTDDNRYRRIFVNEIKSDTINDINTNINNINTRLDTLGFKQASGNLFFPGLGTIQNCVTFTKIGTMAQCNINYTLPLNNIEDFNNLIFKEQRSFSDMYVELSDMTDIENYNIFKIPASVSLYGHIIATASYKYIWIDSTYNNELGSKLFTLSDVAQAKSAYYAYNGEFYHNGGTIVATLNNICLSGDIQKEHCEDNVFCDYTYSSKNLKYSRILKHDSTYCDNYIAISDIRKLYSHENTTGKIFAMHPFILPSVYCTDQDGMEHIGPNDTYLNFTRVYPLSIDWTFSYDISENILK